MKNSIKLFLLLFLIPIFFLAAQNKKEAKAWLQEHKIYYTPQLAGSNPAVKPAVASKSVRYDGDVSSAASQIPRSAKTSIPITFSQLKKQMAAAKNMLSEVTVYSGAGDQRSPQIVGNGTEKFIAFESDDIRGGTYPFGTIEIYQSIDGGASWAYFDGLYHTSFRLTSPQILLIGTDVIVSYLSNGNLWTYRWKRDDGSYISSAVPIPAVSASEFVAGYRIVSDVEDVSSSIYIYAAFLFKQLDGKFGVLFSRSTDTIRTWDPFITLGVTQTELGKFSLGLDYSSSGLFVAYLGTDTSAGSVLIRKSSLYGSESSWTPEIKLPMYFNGGNYKKVGPMISAIGSRVAVVYQYDYYGDAADWKTGSDFDIYAIVSFDGGGSWEERSVGSTLANEILPSITCDADQNFYVSFIRERRVRVSMAGQECAFGVPDSSLIFSASQDDFPSIQGSTVPYDNTAYTTWTDVTILNGLDILGAGTVLKIPPASPIDLNAISVSNTEIKLTWSDNSIDETGFAIYSRLSGTGDDFQRVGTVAADAVVFTATGLTPSVAYDFYVRAFNTNGFSLRTNIKTAAAGGGSTTAPAAPRNFTAIPGNGFVKLAWNKNTEPDFLRYRIYYGIAASSSFYIDSTYGGVTDTIKTISGLTNGTAYIFYVTAVNNAGEESGLSNEANATPNAAADNTPPTINLNPPSGTPVIVNANGQVGSTPQVNANAADAESGVYQMQVAFRNTSELTWSYSPRVDGSTINYAIPTGAFVLNNKPIGVNYRIGAWDNAGNVTWSPYSSIDVQLGTQLTDQSGVLPAASQLDNKTTAYRIISIPYNLTNKQPANLLNSFGSHSENSVSYARWRLQRYVGNQYEDYDQFSQTNAVTPGAAFFIIARDQGLQITIQGEKINRSDVMYNTGITLQNGWNLVGNPFTIPYPIDSLEFYNIASNARAPIRQHAYYSGSGPISGWDTASAAVHHIQPWSGVALFVNSAGNLKFPSTGQLNETAKMNSISSVSPIEKGAAGNWMLAINAYRPEIGMRCEGGSIGMAQGAEEGDDPYDSYIPPIVGDKNVAVYFKNADGAMMRDIRPLNDEGGVWDMKVVTGDAGARVKLQWSDNINLPNSAFEAYLIDVDQKMAHNLKKTQSLEISSGNGLRNFRMVVGKKSFVEENNAGIALTPSSMKLYANYPNPFNPETVIRYSIPDASESYTVTLKVFNVLGQEIATLVNEQKPSGYYEAKFNGMNQSSGIYFYRLSITDGSKTFQEIKKMVLMK